jgi:predicted ATPase
MGFYNLNPERIRDLQSPDMGDVLARDGSNLVSVLERLRANPEQFARIQEYLRIVVPGIQEVRPIAVGPKETLEFRQVVYGSPNPWRFFAQSMSDGTLRALGVLVALFQSTNGRFAPVPLIGIEEPEVALHPAASGALRSSLSEASQQLQVLVTSHSPDLLDDPELDPERLLAVISEDGITRIGVVSEGGRRMLRDQLYTAGELLRLDQLVPEGIAPGHAAIDLFDRPRPRPTPTQGELLEQ